MSNGHGGRRPGAGRKHLDLEEVIDYRDVVGPDGTRRQVGITRHDRIVETIRAWGFDKDAAARIGVTVETLRSWRRQGAAAAADLLAGRRTARTLSKAERQYIDLNRAMDKAEAEARVGATGAIQRAAFGGRHLTTTTTTDTPGHNGAQVRTTATRTEEQGADWKAAAWFLEHRYPAEFTRRVEHVGPEGGAIPVGGPAVDRLSAELAAMAERLALSPDRAEIAPPGTSITTPNGTNGVH